MRSCARFGACGSMVQILKAKVRASVSAAITVKKADEAIAGRDDVTTLATCAQSANGGVAGEPWPQERGLDRDVTAARCFVRATAPGRGLRAGTGKGLGSHRRYLSHGNEDSRAGAEAQGGRLQDRRGRGSDAPEVKGTLSHVPGAWCIETLEDVAKLPRAARRGRAVHVLARTVLDIVARSRSSTTICGGQHDLYHTTTVRSKRCAWLGVESWSLGRQTSANTKHLASSPKRTARAPITSKGRRA